MSQRDKGNTGLEVQQSRENAVRMMRQAVAHGCPLAGATLALEHLAEPFYLGLDIDPDDSDMEVWP